MKIKDITKPPSEMAHCRQIDIKAGSQLFRPGDSCQQFVYLLAGSVRVNLLSESGHSVLLYRLSSGDTCVLTTSCLLSHDNYNAEAIVEEDVTLLVMSAEKFRDALNNSDSFRQFVFASFSNRLSAVIKKVDEVAFQPIESRLASALLHSHAINQTISITHDQLAMEVGSAREVISRKLSLWQNNGLIDRGRGKLTLLDIPALENIATQTNR